MDGPSAPRNTFNKETLLLDPYARGLVPVRLGEWRCVVVDGTYDWHGVDRPRTPMHRTVIYEAHVKSMTELHPQVDKGLRGTYLGLSSDPVIEHLQMLVGQLYA